jgi:phospholipid transport system substrate-binding protein
MMTRRMVLLAAILAAGVTSARAEAAISAAGAPGVVRNFYDALTATMKDGPKLGFAGRRDQLKPAVARNFDLAQMTQLAVGPRWQTLSPQERDDLVAAFGDYSAATYASRFTDYSGQRFDVDANTTANEYGLIVHTKLIDGKGDPVELDYLMKSGPAGW